MKSQKLFYVISLRFNLQKDKEKNSYKCVEVIKAEAG
jgi:hypothetical protein